MVLAIATGAGALPGTAAASVKVTPLPSTRSKGRATGGVRAHRFLKGEDSLAVAWVGLGPARRPRPPASPGHCRPEHARRDGSGVPLAQPVDALGGTPARDAAGSAPAAVSAAVSAAPGSPGLPGQPGKPALPGLPVEPARRAPLAAPEEDSLPFGGSGVIEVD